MSEPPNTDPPEGSDSSPARSSSSPSELHSERTEIGPIPDEVLEAARAASGEHEVEAGDDLLPDGELSDSLPNLDFTPPPRFEIRGIRAEVVGRADEVAAMENCFEQVVLTREPVMLTVAGEPGMGKSRLLDHFRSRVALTAHTPRFFQGQSARREGDPYGPFSSILLQRADISDADERLQMLNKILEVATSLIEGERGIEVAHLLSHLIGIPFPRSPIIERFAEHPERLTMRTHAAVRRLLEADSQAGPLILAFEDLDHSSTETTDLLYYLANNLRDVPVMFVSSVTLQFLEENPDWGQGDFRHVLVELAPLPDGHVADLLKEYLHRAEEIPEELILATCERSRGNPLQVTEIVRTLIEQGVVDTTNEPWVIDRARLAQSDIPADVEGIVETRLALLTPEERQVLDYAAIIGETFWRDAVLSLVRSSAAGKGKMPREFLPGHDPYSRSAEDTLRSLVKKELLIKKQHSTFPETTEFRFAHRITRGLVYARVDADTLLRCHRQVAQWLELAVGEERARHLELLAEHLERGGDRARAAWAYVYAADTARARFANETAIMLYERGLSCFDPEDLALTMEVLHNLGSVYHLVGDYDSALMHYEQMLRSAWQLVSRSKGGVAYNKMGRAYREKGDYRRAVEALQRGMSLFRDCRDYRGVASSMADIGQVHINQGNYDAAHRYATDALRYRRRIGDKRSIANSLWLLGHVDLSIGKLDAAEQRFREARDLFAAAQDREGSAQCLNALGMLSFTREHSDQAVARFEDALRVAQEVGNRRLEATILNNLGEAHALRKELGVAERYLKEAEGITKEIGDKRLTTEVLRNIGAVYQRMNEGEKAREYLQRSLQVASALGSKEFIARALLALAQAHTHSLYDSEVSAGSASEDRNQAITHFEHAIDMYEEMGNDAELARAHTAYGRFLVENQRFRDGRKQLEEAMRLYSRLGLEVGLRDVKKTIIAVRGLGDDLDFEDSGGTEIAPPLVADGSGGQPPGPDPTEVSVSMPEARPDPQSGPAPTVTTSSPGPPEPAPAESAHESAAESAASESVREPVAASTSDPTTRTEPPVEPPSDGGAQEPDPEQGP